MSDQNAVAVADGKAQRLERCRGGAHPLPMSTIRYRLPQRTTLLLPEEPEYNEMNSAMKTSYCENSPPQNTAGCWFCSDLLWLQGLLQRGGHTVHLADVGTQAAQLSTMFS